MDCDSKPDATIPAATPSARYCSFRELVVWREAMNLAIEIHRASHTLPEFEKFGLAQELRKTARSIPSNIAEGFNRRSRAAYRSHVAIALGSQAEIETLVELAVRLRYLSDDSATPLQSSIGRVGRLLHGLWRALG
jgi:four helix bundle protein